MKRSEFVIALFVANEDPQYAGNRAAVYTRILRNLVREAVVLAATHDRDWDETHANEVANRVAKELVP